MVDSIYIQEFNKNYMLIKLKYLGKLDKMINQLETQKIILKLSNEEWQIKNFIMSQLVFKFPFKKKYYEQDFYVSSNNFSAYRLVEGWPNWPGKWVNVYGAKGSGKTHLSKNS